MATSNRLLGFFALMGLMISVAGIYCLLANRMDVVCFFPVSRNNSPAQIIGRLSGGSFLLPS
jgi:hypothetical protein